uniref:Microfibril associated protein 5 n=1 Tax=Pan troglodytes TaxID=9598 RepID=A0A2I3T9B5_PANTR
MSLLGPKVLLFLAAFIITSGESFILCSLNPQLLNDVTQTTPETFTEDPSKLHFCLFVCLFAVLLGIDRLRCWDEKFTCTRLYSVHRPVKQCIHQLCFTSSRRMYIVNKEICSRLVCKEHEAMKDELCRQMAGLPPRRLRRSNYFRLPPCENVDLQRPNGL